MAAVKGVNKTKYDSGAAADFITKGEAGNSIRMIYDSYEASALEAGSTISVGVPLPNKAVVSGIYLQYDALGASSTLKVGDGDDDDRYLAAASSASAGVRNELLIDGFGYQIGTNDDDNAIIITTAGAAVTGTIKIAVFYSL